MKKSFLLFLFAVCSFVICIAQAPSKPSSGDIFQKIQRLDFLGSALYIAAHPDDENTRLISLFANDKHVRSGYLSLTRGDGGQNLIGTEIRERLGLIRTQELLAARRIDGGEQFFTRANDFGYSKHPDETLALWNREEVLHDMVKVIREFRPDIIVNRFDHRRAGETHGHHTASAMLSIEAVEMASDPTTFPSRLTYLDPWNVNRVFFNTGWWFYGSRENFDAADKSNMMAIDVGTFSPVSGWSNGEIAALSRSQHKSQGFGSTGSRGEQFEYLELLSGNMPAGSNDPFEGINTNWTRISGGQKIGEQIDALLQNFNFADPSVHINDMLRIYGSIKSLNESHWKSIKLAEAEEILVAMTGLFLEARTEASYATRGSSVILECEVTNRCRYPITLQGITVQGAAVSSSDTMYTLPFNRETSVEIIAEIKRDARISNPYWLDQPGSLGMYTVEDQGLIGKAQSDPSIQVLFDIGMGDQRFTISRPLVFKINDPVEGEVYDPFYIVPEVSVGFTDPVYVFADRSTKEVVIEVKSFVDGFYGTLSLDRPGSWIVQPAQLEVSLPKKNATGRYSFFVKGPLLSSSAEFGIVLTDTLGNEYTHTVHEINYNHIPKQHLVQMATANFERISLEKKGEKIGYIEGAGDDIPKSLRQLGYAVDMLSVEDVNVQKLKNYDAIVVGIRAYNVYPELKLKKDHLLQYIFDGGTVITQYNTSRGIASEDLGPYVINLSRERVTNEYAPVSLELPDHEVLNYPNKISTRDFEGWVQERGLYFANEWDFRYEAPLASSDPGEPLKQGGLLITKFGKGHFIYTGFSWFRQLPAGVSGAFRLFTNLLSIGKNEIIAPDAEDSNR